MGLLAKASREHKASPQARTERPASGAALPLRPFGKAEAACLSELLPGKSDILGVRLDLRSADPHPWTTEDLSEALARALGFSALVFRGRKNIPLAFAVPRSDWDEELYSIQLARAVALNFGKEAASGLAVKVGRFSRTSPTLTEDLAKFAGA